MTPSPNEEFVKEGAQKVTEKDVEKVVTRSEDIKKKFLSGGPLNRFIEDGKMLISLVKDYWSRAYRQVPYGTIAASAFSLIYVFNPLDLVPDVLPVIGQVDDVAVISACLLMIEHDLKKYKDWKKTREEGGQ
jgi:uncharacterized membrane protein YkvA (DUF1232 family)